jgi:hypothetical protein
MSNFAACFRETVQHDAADVCKVSVFRLEPDSIISQNRPEINDSPRCFDAMGAHKEAGSMWRPDAGLEHGARSTMGVRLFIAPAQFPF